MREDSEKVYDRAERRVLREIRNDPYTTLSGICEHVNQEIEEEKYISKGTIQKITHEAGYFS